jgi:hypothetical protein
MHIIVAATRPKEIDQTMKAISRRLEKLEKVFAPVAESEDRWGTMAAFRDDLLRQAQQRGEPSVAELAEELEHLGPLGLWRETARGYLSDHGFVQGGNESFAATMARALGISIDELRVCIAEGRVGAALLDRFREPRTAADNVRVSGAELTCPL